MVHWFVLVFVTLCLAPEKILGIIEAEYGSWRSPITSDVVTQDVLFFMPPIMVDPRNRGRVFWFEIRPQEGGRGVVASYREGDTEIETWTPPGFSVFSLVHSIGGGAFFVYNRRVYFSNAADQRLYVQNKRCSYVEPLTPAGKGWRYGDGRFFSKLDDGGKKINRIVIIREDHGVKQSGERNEEENTIVVINPETKEQSVLVRGANFYMWPRVSPDGKKLAWVQWYHPNMPWDHTELWVAEFNDDMFSLKPESFRMVKNGSSILQPSWTKTNTLMYVSDQTDWWNLYTISAKGEHRNILKKDRELALAPWNLGHYQYSLRNGNLRKIAALFDGELYRIHGVTGKHELIKTGYSRHYFLAYGKGSIVYILAASTDKTSSVIRVDMDKVKVDVIREGSGVSKHLDKGYISDPEEIQFRTANNDTVYAFYYPPKNKDYKGPAQSLPPLLLKLHGGPTGQTFDVLKLRYQYFTSRGFGILDVNYRGSTGYGREYRRKLYKNWGIYDNQDAVYGAFHMVDTGRADVNKLTIDGESAGGYTTLSCLTFWPDVFKAAASYFGIGDLEGLVEKTHKFESRYVDNLIGPLPEYTDVYRKRSPIHSIDKLKTPTIFFHGSRDVVVPPEQSQKMFDALNDKNITTAYVLFEGEQHGFRLKRNIQKALDAELYFYSVVYGFDLPDIQVDVTIENPPTDD